MPLRKLPVTYKQWRTTYLSAKRNEYNMIGRGKKGSVRRLQIAHDLRQIRGGKKYKFSKTRLRTPTQQSYL